MYLFILTSLSIPQETLRQIFASTKEARQSLLALFVVDEDVIGAALNEMEQNSFLDHAAAETVVRVLVEEYTSRGNSLLHEVETQARAVGVPIESMLKKGVLLEVVQSLLPEKKIERIFILQQTDTKFSKVVLTASLHQLRSTVSLPVEMV